jgi:hypothetical protein
MVKTFGVLVGVVALLVTGWFFGTQKTDNFGSVARTGEYHKTTIASGTLATTTPIQVGSMTLGSVIMLSTTSAGISLLDWDGTTSTVSTTIATFPNNVTQGTYTFDTVVLKGLYYVLPVTSTGQMVITHR